MGEVLVQVCAELPEATQHADLADRHHTAAQQPQPASLSRGHVERPSPAEAFAALAAMELGSATVQPPAHPGSPGAAGGRASPTAWTLGRGGHWAGGDLAQDFGEVPIAVLLNLV